MHIYQFFCKNDVLLFSSPPKTKINTAKTYALILLTPIADLPHDLPHTSHELPHTSHEFPMSV